MKVIVDLECCYLNVNCFDECFEVFVIDDNDKLVVLQEKFVEEFCVKVEFVVDCCLCLVIKVFD